MWIFVSQIKDTWKERMDIPLQLPLEGILHSILDQHIVSPCPHQALVLPELNMEKHLIKKNSHKKNMENIHDKSDH
jgi:hypothetical protein